MKQTLVLLSLAALAALSSCGGGGDGSPSAATPPPPTFPTTQANLTSANAPTFARFAELAVRAAASARVGEFLAGPAGAGTFTDGGCFAAGAGQATLALNSSTGNVSGTATFVNFDRCYGMRLSGSASVTGTLAAGNRVDAMSFTFTNFSYASTGTALQLSGTIALDWISFPPDSRYVMTVNATASGAGQFRVASFQVDSVLVAGEENVLFSGRLTASDGFVDITPGPTRVDLPSSSTGLQNGAILITGANAIANVRYNGALAPTITITPVATPP
jgi:hypothetical protein